jgi:hypothetical protein
MTDDWPQEKPPPYPADDEDKPCPPPVPPPDVWEFYRRHGRWPNPDEA